MSRNYKAGGVEVILGKYKASLDLIYPTPVQNLQNDDTADLLLNKSLSIPIFFPFPSPCTDQYLSAFCGCNQSQTRLCPPNLVFSYLYHAMNLPLSLLVLSWVPQLYIHKRKVYGTKYVSSWWLWRPRRDFCLFYRLSFKVNLAKIALQPHFPNRNC